MQTRRSQVPHHPDFHITSSTMIASTLHITRLNTRNPGPVDPAAGSVLTPGINVPMPATVSAAHLPVVQGQLRNDLRRSPDTNDNPLPIPENGMRQPETGHNPGIMNSFSSLLLWLLGGASSEGLNSFFSIFRDMRDQGQFYAEHGGQENHAGQDDQ